VGRFVRRLIGAARLDASVYEAIESDRSALSQALLVVLLSSAAAGVAVARGQPRALVTTAVIGLATWLVWAILVYQIGGRVLAEPDTHVDLPRMLRMVGFAAAPGSIQVLGAIPGWTAPVLTISWIWMLAAMVVAVHRALDSRRPSHTLAVCAVAAAVAVGMAILLTLMLTPTAVGRIV
jgi:hypothetical protein